MALGDWIPPHMPRFLCTLFPSGLAFFCFLQSSLLLQFAYALPFDSSLSLDKFTPFHPSDISSTPQWSPPMQKPYSLLWMELFIIPSISVCKTVNICVFTIWIIWFNYVIIWLMPFSLIRLQASEGRDYFHLCFPLYFLSLAYNRYSIRICWINKETKILKYIHFLHS